MLDITLFSHKEEVHKISTLHNPADMFTKPVPKSKFDHCLSLLNVDCWGEVHVFLEGAACVLYGC